MQKFKTGIRENINTTSNSRVYKLFKIKKIIKDNGCCVICIKRHSGKVKKYHTYC